MCSDFGKYRLKAKQDFRSYVLLQDFLKHLMFLYAFFFKHLYWSIIAL